MELEELSNNLLNVQDKVHRVIIGLKENENSDEDFKVYQQNKNYLIEIIDLTMFKLLRQEEYTDEEKEILLENLRGFLDELKDQNLLKDGDILEFLDEELLESIEYIDKSTYTKKKIRLSTKHFYEQNKYNLFQENSEGFSILLTELFTSVNSSTFNEKLINIIGYYDLDPNRVCDLMIDVMSCKKENHELYVNFMKQLNPESVEKILIRKLNNLHAKDKGRSLIHSAALLVKANLVSGQAIWNVLKPSIPELHSEYDDKYEAVFQLFKRNFVLNFLTSDEDFRKDEEEEKKLKEKTEVKIYKNQKFYFLASLLETGSYDDFIMFYKLVEASFYFPTKDYILTSIFDFFKPLLSELLSFFECNNEKALPQNLIDNFLSFLDICKTNISLHLNIFEQSVMILVQLNTRIDDFAKISTKYLTMYLLPSLFNNSLSDETLTVLYNAIRKLLFTYSFSERYKIYDAIMTKELYRNPYMLNSSLIAKVKKFLKTVCEGKDLEKTNSDIFSRNLKSHPFFVFSLAIFNLKMFDNLIPTITNACEGLPDVVVDICNFLLLRDVTTYEHIEIDRDTIDPQFLNLCKFISCFSKKYYMSDLKGYLLLLGNKLASEEPNDIYYVFLLTFLLQAFLGFEIVHDLNEKQIFGMAAGPELRTSLLYFDENFENSKIASKSLFDTLMEIDYMVNNTQRFPMFFILFFQLCKKTINATFSLRNKTLKCSNQLIDTYKDAKDLMIQFYQQNCEQITLVYSEEKFLYVLENEMHLPLYDVFSIIKMIYNENERIEKFDYLYNMINKYRANILSRNIAFLENHFEVVQDKFISDEDMKWLSLFWLFNNEHLTSLSLKYNNQIEKLEKMIDNKALETNQNQEKEKNIINIKIRNLVKERDSYAVSHQKFLDFYSRNFAYSEFKFTKFIKLFCVVQRLVTIQDSLYTATWLKITLIDGDANLYKYYDQVFCVLREVFPLLNGSTDTESVHIALFILCLLKQLQSFYDDNDEFEKELERISLKFTKNYENNENQNEELESINSDNDITQIKELIIRELDTFIEDIRSFFMINHINFCKNTITFLVKLMNIVPLNYKQCVDIIEMLEENKSYIDKFGDLKLRCTAYKQMVKKKMEFFKSLGQEKIYLASKEEEKKEKYLKEKEISESEKNEVQEETTEKHDENAEVEHNITIAKDMDNTLKQGDGENIYANEEDESGSIIVDEELKALKNEYNNDLKEIKSCEDDDIDADMKLLSNENNNASLRQKENNSPKKIVQDINTNNQEDTKNEVNYNYVESDNHSVYTIEEGRKHQLEVNEVIKEMKSSEYNEEAEKSKAKKDEDNNQPDINIERSTEEKNNHLKKQNDRESSNQKEAKAIGKTSDKKIDYKKEYDYNSRDRDYNKKTKKYTRDKDNNDRNFDKKRHYRDNRNYKYRDNGDYDRYRSPESKHRKWDRKNYDIDNKLSETGENLKKRDQRALKDDNSEKRSKKYKDKNDRQSDNKNNA